MIIKYSGGFLNLDLISSVHWIGDTLAVYTAGDDADNRTCTLKGNEAKKMAEYLDGIAFLDLTQESK